MDDIMNDMLGELAHKLIEESGRKEFEARRPRRLLREKSINLEDLWEMLPKEPKPFDIEEVRDETHLRKIIMDRALDTVVHNVTASVMGGPMVPFADLPEDQQARLLNKIMLDFLDSNSGPGPILRRSIALTILSYRMRNRLKELLSALNPSSHKFKRAEQGIAYIEKQIKAGMFYFEAWTFFTDDPGGKQSDLAKQKLVERLLKRETKD
ncbi:MAG: hypothetical protein LBI74_08750 [Synergistaceae bacterium]|jgi:hypothetical protein|nr:hypothetical protein [Synergistaceae bacterium]